VDVLRRGPCRAGELASELGLAASAMSRHLRVLRESRLVAESHPTFDARVRIYTLRPQPMAELRSWLAQTEQGWAEQLAAFRAHLEATGQQSSTPPAPEPA
jgi:DNA-binding MarR family transcriptional regulator